MGPPSACAPHASRYALRAHDARTSTNALLQAPPTVCYTSRKRNASCTLDAAGVTAVAPAVRALHHDPAWLARLSRRANVTLFALDEQRFPFAFTAIRYAHGGHNMAHRDSTRTSGRVWSVLLSLWNNSSSHLVIEGVPCRLAANEAALFEGSERTHWVTPLREAATVRLVLLMEYTDVPPERVRWAWPWSKTLVNAERIFFH